MREPLRYATRTASALVTLLEAQRYMPVGFVRQSPVSEVTQASRNPLRFASHTR